MTDWLITSPQPDFHAIGEKCVFLVEDPASSMVQNEIDQLLEPDFHIYSIDGEALYHRGTVVRSNELLPN